MFDLHHRHGIVVEDCWHVFGGELVGGVANQKASLANGTVSDHHTPEIVGSRQQFWGWKSVAYGVFCREHIGRFRWRKVIDGRHDVVGILSYGDGVDSCVVEMQSSSSDGG